MKVKKISTNFCQVGNNENGIYVDADYYEVGQRGVLEINYRPAQGEGDKHRCEILFENGSMRIMFNLDSIDLEPND